MRVQRKLGQVLLQPVWGDLMVTQNKIPLNKVDPASISPALVRIHDRTKLDKVPGVKLFNDVLLTMTARALQLGENEHGLLLTKLEEEVAKHQRERRTK